MGRPDQGERRVAQLTRGAGALLGGGAVADLRQVGAIAGDESDSSRRRTGPMSSAFAKRSSTVMVGAFASRSIMPMYVPVTPARPQRRRGFCNTQTSYGSARLFLDQQARGCF